MWHKAAVLASAAAVMAWAAAPAQAQKAAAQTTATLKDAAGDVRGGKDNLDVVEVGLDSDGKSLLISATMAGDLATLMKDRMAGEALRVFIDTDDNPATGGAVDWADGRKGYDAEVQVESCVKYAAGEACMGGLSGPATGFFSSYDVKLWKTAADGGSFDQQFMSMSGKSGPSAGKTLKVSVPYDKLGLHAGQTVRVAVREQDAGFDASAVMPDVRLKLK
jgi:hypothetical protein